MHTSSLPDDGSREPAVTRDSDPGRGAAALDFLPEPASQARPSLSLIPAAHGYPGGIGDALDSLDGELLGEPGAACPIHGEGDQPGVPSGLDQAEVWQRSLAAWQDAGLDWQPEAGPLDTVSPAAASAGTASTAAAPAKAGAAPETGMAQAPAGRDWSTEPIPVITDDAPAPAGQSPAPAAVAPERAPVTGKRQPAGRAPADEKAPATDAPVRADAPGPATDETPAAVGSAPATDQSPPAVAGSASAADETARATDEMAPPTTSPASPAASLASPAAAAASAAHPGAAAMDAPAPEDAPAPPAGTPAAAPPADATAPAAPPAGATARAGADGGQAATGRARHRRRRLAVAAVVICGVVVAGTVAGVAVTRSPQAPAAPAFGLAGAPYPPGRLGDTQFPALPAGTAGAVHLTLAGVAAAGNTVVAVGSQPGVPAARPVILVSADGGHTWQQAALAPPAIPAPPAPAAPGSALAGGLPPATAATSSRPLPPGPVMVSGGDGRWLALGAGAGWVSADGTHWRPVTGLAGTGLPGTVAGDQVAALARTGSGFLAVGQHLQQAAGHQARGPVLWSSPDGVTWRRVTGSALPLHSSAGQVLGLRSVAASGSSILIAGDVAGTAVAPRGHRRTRVPAESPGLWRSSDGGATWQPAPLPAGLGATGGLAGIAATRSGFVAVRPGFNRHDRRDAVVFTSPRGAAWHPVARLVTGHRAALRQIAVVGNGNGAAVTGIVRGQVQAFVSATGTSWSSATSLGGAYGRPLTGVALAPGGVLVAAGMDVRRASLPDNPRPFLLLAGHRITRTGQQALAGADTADVVVNGLASGAGHAIAAGSADGAPAVWVAPGGASGAGSAGGTTGAGTAGGAWTRASIRLPHTWDGGGAGLTGATYGPAGWLAVGSRGGFGRQPLPASAAPAQAPPRPVVMTSADGTTWHAAPNARPLLAPGVSLAQAAHGQSGYVVVGSQTAGGSQTAAAWHSAGLNGWASARSVGQGGPSGAGPSQMLAVTSAGTGFVAAGYAASSPAVWTSPDGSGWRLMTLPVPAGTAGAVLTQLAAHGNQVIATGTATTPAGTQGFAATSADGGHSWHESPLPLPASVTASQPNPGGPAAQPGGQPAHPAVSVTALTAVTGGFVAAGVASTPAGQDVLVWWSRGGLGWQAAAPAVALLRGQGPREITALAQAGHQLSAFGLAAGPAGQHPIRWQARLR